MKTDFLALELKDGKLVFVDQTRLPLTESYVVTDNYERIAEAIEKLEIRGAPAIGIAAAYALAFSVKECASDEIFSIAYQRLASTRPTAVNLFWALNAMKETYVSAKLASPDSVFPQLINRAIDIHKDDVDKCGRIAGNGLPIFTRPMNVLTHCNAGSLATGGIGTAVGVIKKGFDHGLVLHVYSDETRPLFQGSRLTAFELSRYGIPFSINTDSTTAFLMQQGKIDLVITGADRVAANGDSANKIGTYNLAVLCKYHNIPFYIAAPTSTIDSNCKSGKEIIIELRDKREVTHLNSEAITSDEFQVYSPAFDVTPAELITGIITEEALYKYPFNF